MKSKGVKRFALVMITLLSVGTILGGCTKKTDKDLDVVSNETPSEVKRAAMVLETLSSYEDLDSFSLNQVVLTDEYTSNAQKLEVDYLTSFDVDRLLAGFRDTASLDMKGASRYGGWESSLIGGHSVGHYLTACAQAYVNAGVSKEDKDKIYSMVTTLVDGLLECQENTKGASGFIFGASINNDENVEAQFDHVEKGQTNISTQAWVPWYTMHKLIAGLISIYEDTGYENALTVAKGLGDWTYNRVTAWSEQTRKTVLGIEYGGMNDCLYDLYAVTQDEKYAIAAHQFDDETLFKRIPNGEENALTNLHANTTIPKFIGALNRYITTHGKTIGGEMVDASEYLAYAEAFWQMVIERHTYITGGNSEWEHFGEDHVLFGERTNANNETCNSYNMLMLSKALFMITGDVKYANYYENTYYNSILSSQNSETGMTTYFQPMATGYFKVYSTEFSSFWCCTGSGMENFTKLNDSIYFHKDNTIFVNMYLSSVLTWEDKNITLTQTSDIPNSTISSFAVKVNSGESANVNIAFRVPDWAAGDVKLLVNNEVVETKIIDGYLFVGSTFYDGDVITLDIPMNVVAYTLPDEASALAFKYGPIVLSADLGTEDLKTTTTGVNVTIPASKLIENDIVVLPTGLTREDFSANINQYMVRDNKDLTFKLDGTDLLFKPHYTKNEERYGIYWSFVTEEEMVLKNAEKVRSEDTIIDTVQPGYGQYENDELHQMIEEGNGSTGVSNDGTYRYANGAGSFTYQMAVKVDGNNYLAFTLRKADNGKSLLIMSGDQMIFNETLHYEGEEESYTMLVKLSKEVIGTAQKKTANGTEYDVINLTFAGLNGGESAKVCDFIYIKDVKYLYELDEHIAYFVDCGDHNVYTTSEGDKLGVYNSVTEQIYGVDGVTGMRWGLMDDPFDQYGGSANSEALYTAHTWAYEFDTSDNLPKEASNRYTKNQFEEGVAERYLDYGFQLPNGTYEVEIGFANPWNCSNLHNVYANLGREGETLLAESFNVVDEVLTATVTVTDGELTLNFRNASASGLAINVSYIIVRFGE